MNWNKVYSFFTFGIFLIIIGIAASFFNWPQANLVMAIGFVFELAAALIYIWNKLKK